MNIEYLLYIKVYRLYKISTFFANGPYEYGSIGKCWKIRVAKAMYSGVSNVYKC